MEQVDPHEQVGGGGMRCRRLCCSNAVVDAPCGPCFVIVGHSKVCEGCVKGIASSGAAVLHSQHCILPWHTGPSIRSMCSSACRQET